MAERIVPTLIFLASAPLLAVSPAAWSEELPPLPVHGLDLDMTIPEPPQDLSIYEHPRPLTLTEEPLTLRAHPADLPSHQASGGRARTSHQRPTVVVRPPGALAERQRRQAEAGQSTAGPVPHYSSLPELRYSRPDQGPGGGRPTLSSEPIISASPMAGELAEEEARLLAAAAQRRMAAGAEPTQALRRIVLIAEVDDPLLTLARSGQGAARSLETGREQEAADADPFVAGIDFELPQDVLAELSRYEGQALNPETTIELVESLMMSLRLSGRPVAEIQIVDESLARGEIALMVVESRG